MLYKKWLFVPAKERFLCHTDELCADVLIYDLEDSIKPEDKSNALIRLCRKLQEKSVSEIYVRINPGKQGLTELECLSDYHIDGIMVPKVETLGMLQEYRPFIENKKIIALVESIAGIKNLDSIASSDVVFGIAFGGEDFCRELGVETNDSAMQYARSQIVLTAKYYHKYCLDTISLEYKDIVQFKQQFQNSISMGFDSKLLIHPSQAKVICSLEEEFNIEEMRKIVCEYEDSPDGLLCLHGRWYEKPHIDLLKQMIQHAEGEDRERL